jgi:hypothetical protein
LRASDRDRRIAAGARRCIMTMPLFLKRVLLLDAAGCLAMAAVLVPGATMLAPWLGLERGLLVAAGAALAPLGLLILWIATRRSLHAWLVYLVIAGNLVWSADSLILLRLAPEISVLGLVFTGGQAGLVALLALLEWLGLRRARVAIPA